MGSDWVDNTAWTDWKQRYIDKCSENKALFMALIKAKARSNELTRQMEMVQVLQMQFMSMEKSSEAAYNTLYGLYFSPLYKNNNHTKKIKKLLFEERITGWTDEQFHCLCAHFALQLAGVEE